MHTRTPNSPCLSAEGRNETVRLGEVVGGLHQDGVGVRAQVAAVVHHFGPLLHDGEEACADIDFLYRFGKTVRLISTVFFDFVTSLTPFSGPFR